MIDVFEWVDGILIFRCPACEFGHHVDPKRWSFNGDLKRPTVSPSILVHSDGKSPRCHFFIRDGRIEFCRDSTHALAGQTVPLGPVWPD